MRLKTILLLLLINISYLSAQVLKGTVSDSEGNPVPYATIYIQELKQGTASNARGDYEIPLPAGKYTVFYQSLGFEPDLRNVVIGTNPVSVNIVLQVQYYEIPEVRISASGEDPAYAIMRKAIGLAPYYLHHVEYYKAEIYLKGNLTIKNIPRILQRSMKIEASSSSGNSASTTTMKEGDVYIMESVNDLVYTAPDKYVQTMLSYNSTFPEQGNQISPMDFIQASFYEPVLADMAISPLSPDAFFHYNFAYKGASVQGNYIVDKIEVIPKRKSQQLFSGIIYIIEDLWCLHSLDLVNNNIAGTIRVQVLYIPVQEEVWMPVSHKFDVNLSIIGFRADAGYGSSIKYNEVRINQNLEKPAALTIDYRKARASLAASDTSKSKTQQQIEKILAKDELSNRDMVRLSGLLNKESKASVDDSIRNNLEVKQNVVHIIEKDAGKKDSAYWAGIRPIPLSEAEMKSLRSADSIKSQLATIDIKSDSSRQSGTPKKKFITSVRRLMSGFTWSDTLGRSFVHGGLIDFQNLSFNTVDGFLYGIDFRLSKTWDNKNSLSLYPDFKWAFSRQSFNWIVNGQFRFDRMHQSQVYFRTGITGKDINNNGGVNTFINSVTSLFMKRNYLKLYESRYATVGYRSEPVNGLYIDLSAGYEDRRILENNTSFSFIKTDRNYTDNLPDNPYLEPSADPSYPLSDQRHGDFSLSISYTPRQMYSIVNDAKIPRGSDYPTFSLTWKHGLNEFKNTATGYRHYDLIRFEASKRRDIGAFGEFRWRFRTGGFINNSGIAYLDIFHFNSQPLPVLLNDYEDSFQLPAFYSLSTPGYFSEFHMKYTTPYLLIKLLPVISNTLMRENINISFLWSRYHEAYTEIGYSISEFLLLGEVGVYSGFYNLSYSSTGFKLILRFN